MPEQPRAVARGSRSPETLPDGGGAQCSRIWRDGLYSGDERPAAAPQVTAGGVGEDEGIGRPQQWFVAWFAVLVVKLAVPAQSMDRFVEHVHIVAVLSYRGLEPAIGTDGVLAALHRLLTNHAGQAVQLSDLKRILPETAASTLQPPKPRHES